jgi:plasmid stabilization system protein ParE
VGVFPYAVFFLVLGDRVRVFAILHQHRRPSTWSKRQRS